MDGDEADGFMTFLLVEKRNRIWADKRVLNVNKMDYSYHVWKLVDAARWFERLFKGSQCHFPENPQQTILALLLVLVHRGRDLFYQKKKVLLIISREYTFILMLTYEQMIQAFSIMKDLAHDYQSLSVKYLAYFRSR